MLTLHFMDDVPFHTVYVHGLVRDSHGQKMSKSKGNVLDPIDLIDGIDLESLVSKRTAGMMQPQLQQKVEKMTRKEFPEGIASYGTDALRYTYYSLASNGRDINFDVGRIEGFRNFCNKIWNAARYVLMNTEEQDCGQDGSNDYELSLADRWITSRLQQVKKDVAEGIENYRFDLASQALYSFVWNEYCDWYLELSKPVLWDDNAPASQKKGTRRTLIRVLEEILRIAHPMMPFITEEIWQRVKTLAGQEGDTVMLQAYPQADNALIDAQAVTDIEWLQGIILALRNIRGEINISPAKPIIALLKNTTAEDATRLEANRQFLAKLAKLESIEVLPSGAEAPMSAIQLVGDLEVLVPMQGLIDVTAEIARLSKEAEKLSKELSGVNNKLANASFVDKAPAAVVEKEKVRQADLQMAHTKLQQQLQEIQAMV